MYDSILHNMLLFLMPFKLFRIIETYFFLWPNGSLLETKLAIKMETTFVYLFIRSLVYVQSFFAFRFLLILCGDAVINAGPGHSTSLSFCYQNLNSISVHDFVKISPLQVHSTIHKINITCLSETFLNNSLQSYDESLVLKFQIDIS